MLLYEKEISIPAIAGHKNLLSYLSKIVLEKTSPNEIPIRFAVTQSNGKGCKCELGVLRDPDSFVTMEQDAIFKFKKRQYESFDKFNAVLLVPQA